MTDGTDGLFYSGQNAHKTRASASQTLLGLLLIVTAVLLTALSSQPVQADERFVCKQCDFGVELPKEMTPEETPEGFKLKERGFELEVRVDPEADYEATIKELGRSTLWRYKLRATRFEMQERPENRGTKRGVSYASQAGTATVRERLVWVSWIIYKRPQGGVTTFVYKLQGNPSDPQHLDHYNAINTSLRWTQDKD